MLALSALSVPGSRQHSEEQSGTVLLLTPLLCHLAERAFSEMPDLSALVFWSVELGGISICVCVSVFIYLSVLLSPIPMYVCAHTLIYI